MNILLNGATGKVGRCIERLAEDDSSLRIVGRGSRTQPLSIAADAEVVIDFSRPEATLELAERAAAAGLPLVTGTTGFDDAQRERLLVFARAIPICHAANFAVGVHLLARLARQAAATLGEAFDLELVETHHRDKVDAPSGTALMLARAAAEGRGRRLEDLLRTDGHAGAARSPGSIGVQSLRGGDVVGEHSVLLLGDGERIELSHRATDRSLFARGALRAAAWIRGRAPGLYGLDDVLGG